MVDAGHARIVLTTASSVDEARRLARMLVDERLAACVSLVPSVESIYRWQGKVEEATETLLLIKTTAERLAHLETRMLTLHSYDTPELLVLPVEAGSAPYLRWLLESVDGATIAASGGDSARGK